MRRTIVVFASSTMPADLRANLSPPLDPHAAEQLYEAFVLDSLDKASTVPDAEFVIAYGPNGDRLFLRESAPRADRYEQQVGDTCTDKLVNSLELLCGHEQAVVAMGVQSPTFPARCLELAFDALSAGKVNLVLGPASSGGLYLVGTNLVDPEPLGGIDWGAPNAVEAAVEMAASLNLGWYLLPEWYKVNTSSDLAHLKAELLDRSAINHPTCHTQAILEALSCCGAV